MKKGWMHLICLLLAAMLLAGCGKSDEAMDGDAKLQQILKEVTFDTELGEVGSNAVLYFPDLPDGAEIRLYTGSGYFADEAALLTFASKSDAQSAMKVVNQHLEELRSQFQNYVPQEVGKIDAAVTVQSGNQILLCISNDSETVRKILDGTGSDAEPSFSADETFETLASRATEPPQSYPVLKSRSGTYHSYGNGVIRVDNAAYELYSFNRSSAGSYAELINKIAASLRGKTKVYDILIPIGSLMIPDDIASQLAGTDNQGRAIDQISALLSDDVTAVNPYPLLMQHRDEYLYFRTDYHWNGRGAYYGYEAFCAAKGVTPYPLSQRRQENFDQFIGALYYNNSGKDAALRETPDTVEAFHPHSPRASMRYTDETGKTYDWNIIMDVSSWDSATKYSTFAAADNPIAVFENPDVTDGSVAVVVKESYGNALMPYLVDHYSTIYELDYRYWDGDLVDFVTEKQADDLIFANNLSMVGSNLLIGKLANLIK